MPRPVTARKIAKDLHECSFHPEIAPANEADEVFMTLDGLEALRLADLEGLYQEAAAVHMGVSRATFARVLNTARHAVAEALVQGKILKIRGGTIAATGSTVIPCPIHSGDRRNGRDCLCDPETTAVAV